MGRRWRKQSLYSPGCLSHHLQRLLSLSGTDLNWKLMGPASPLPTGTQETLSSLGRGRRVTGGAQDSPLPVCVSVIILVQTTMTSCLHYSSLPLGLLATRFVVSITTDHLYKAQIRRGHCLNLLCLKAFPGRVPWIVGWTPKHGQYDPEWLTKSSCLIWVLLLYSPDLVLFILLLKIFHSLLEQGFHVYAISFEKHTTLAFPAVSSSCSLLKE